MAGMKEAVGADTETTASAREKVVETLEAMHADFNSRWGDDTSNQLNYQIGHRNRPIGVHRLAVVAYVLDPRFKRLRYIPRDRRTDVWKWLEEEAAKLIESKEQRTKENEENEGELYFLHAVSSICISTLMVHHCTYTTCRNCNGSK